MIPSESKIKVVFITYDVLITIILYTNGFLKIKFEVKYAVQSKEKMCLSGVGFNNYYDTILRSFYHISEFFSYKIKIGETNKIFSKFQIIILFFFLSHNIFVKIYNCTICNNINTFNLFISITK